MAAFSNIDTIYKDLVRSTNKMLFSSRCLVFYLEVVKEVPTNPRVLVSTNPLKTTQKNLIMSSMLSFEI